MMTEVPPENTKLINASFVFCLDALNNEFKDVKLAPPVEQKLEEENKKLKKIIDLIGKDGLSRELHIVIEKSDKEAVGLLLEAGADPYFERCKGETALFTALKFEKYEIAELFIQNGVDVNKPATNGEQIVFPLIKGGCVKQLEFLLKKGLNLNICSDNENKSVPIGLAAYHENVDIVGLFIKHGADVNKCNGKDESPLFLANGNSDQCKIIFKMLVEHGADVNKCDKIGNSPLAKAAFSNNTEFSKLLVEKGANTQCCYDGKNPLGWAIYRNNETLTKLFLEKGLTWEKTKIHCADQRFFKKIKKEFKKQKKQMEKAAANVVAPVTTPMSATVTTPQVPADYIKTVLTIGEKTYPYEGSINLFPAFIEQVSKIPTNNH